MGGGGRLLNLNVNLYHYPLQVFPFKKTPREKIPFKVSLYN